MRLAGVSCIEAANAFLETWLAPFNEKFAVVAREEEDGHRPFPEGMTRQSVFCIEETRTIGKDWTVRHGNVWYQIRKDNKDKNKNLPPVGSKVIVQTGRDTQVVIATKQGPLSIQRLDKAPEKVSQKAEPPQTTPAPVLPRPPHRPATDHPWRGESKEGVPHSAPSSVPKPAKPARPAEIDALTEQYLGIPLVLSTQQTTVVY